MGAHHDASLVGDALAAAVATRGRPRMPNIIFHPDPRGPNAPPPPASLPANGRVCGAL
jgi:hypothetical protein